ncbi:MAG: alpha/beta fold hydrolase [Acidimicrobiia bacterium]|nr:alpha/beta fold hydrolase [Acidimicrobiia bacterium]
MTLAIERIVDPVEGMHRAIAGRWFGALHGVATPVQIAHDATSTVVYESIRLVGTAVGLGLDAAVNLRPSTADGIRAVTNSLWGDRLGRHRDRLGIAMAFRDRNGAVVPIGEDFPTPVSGHLVVLVHGLANTERSWHGTDASPGLLTALEDHPDLTPLSLRYNTGLAIADNAQLLAELLEDVLGSWPEPVESISLVGHSMGGLVANTACSVATAAGHSWINDVTHIVALGSPYLGAPIEKLVAVASQGLDVAHETRPLAKFLDRRSRGIKDLRDGAQSGQEGLPLSAQHHLVAGVFTSDPSHPLGAAFGDLMVRIRSALGNRSVESANVMVVGGVKHSELTHDEAVVDQVMRWIEPRPPGD